MGSSLVYGTKLLSQIASVLRHSPGTQETAEDRSRARYRNAALYGSATLLGKVISIGASLLTVRLVFQYLGAERYGMWMTISSIVIMFGSADLGMSSGLVNAIADASGRQDLVDSRRASASAFWLQTGIAAILSVAMLAALPFINTARLFNVHSETAVRESGPALIVFFLCVVVNLPLGTVRGVQTGLQKGFLNSLWAIFGSLLSLAALLVAIHLHAGLPMLILALSGPPILALILNGIELFGWSHPELFPRPRDFSLKSASKLFQTGVMFFLLQLSLTIGMQTDNIVIAQIMGAKSVPLYSVPMRMFNVLVSLAVMVSGTMWPAYAEAFARSDWAWVRRSFMRVLKVGVGINIVLALVLIFIGNRLLAWWVGPQIQASRTFLVVMGVSCVLMSFVNTSSVLLNGLGKFRAQVIFGLLMAGLNLLLSIIFVKHYGIIGAVLGTATAVATVQVIPMAVLTRKYLGEMASPQSSLDPKTVRN